MDLQISAITLKVRDMDRSLDFYHGILGLDIKYQNPAFSTLIKRGAVLNLEKDNPENHWGRIIFYSDDIEKLWNHFRENGIRLSEKPQKSLKNEISFSINDPDGHEILFVQKGLET